MSRIFSQCLPWLDRGQRKSSNNGKHTIVSQPVPHTPPSLHNVQLEFQNPFPQTSQVGHKLEHGPDDVHRFIGNPHPSPKPTAATTSGQQTYHLMVQGAPPIQEQGPLELLKLPREILTAIGHHLGQQDRFQWGQSHPYLRSIVHDPTLLPHQQTPLSKAFSQQAEPIYQQFCRRAEQFQWSSASTQRLATQATQRLAQVRQSYRLSTGRYREIPLHPQGMSRLLSCSQDGRFVVVAEKKQSYSTDMPYVFALYDVTCRSIVRHPLLNAKQFIGDAWFSPDSRWLIMSQWFGEDPIQLWDLHHLEQPPASLAIENQKVTSIEFLPEHDEIITIENNKTHQKWDLHTQTAQQDPLFGDEMANRHVNFDTSFRRMVKHLLDNRKVVYDLTQWPVQKISLDTSPEIIQFIRFSADGTHLLTQSEQQSPKLWDLSQHPAYCQSLAQPQHLLHDAVFSADNRWLVTQITGEELCLWDTHQEHPTPNILKDTRQHAKRWVEFSPNSQWLLIPTYDLKSNRLHTYSQAKLWHLLNINLEPIHLNICSNPNYRPFQSSTFSHDSQWLATVNHHEAIQLWRLTAKELIPTAPFGTQISNVWFSPDDTKCYAFNRQMQVVIFDFA